MYALLSKIIIIMVMVSCNSFVWNYNNGLHLSLLLSWQLRLLLQNERQITITASFAIKPGFTSLVFHSCFLFVCFCITHSFREATISVCFAKRSLTTITWRTSPFIILTGLLVFRGEEDLSLTIITIPPNIVIITAERIRKSWRKIHEKLLLRS